jgi:hypothetical protein
MRAWRRAQRTEGEFPVPISATKRHYLSLLMIVTLCLAGCGRAINRSAERRLREALPDLLGPARQYQVHVDSAPGSTLRGHMANVTINGDDIELRNGLLLDQLHLDLKGVDVDVDHGRLRNIQEAGFVAMVGEASLDEFLAGEAPAGETFRNIGFTLRDNRVTIRGERVVLGVGVPFQITGPLQLAGPQRIRIDPQRLTLVGISLTGLPLRFLKSRFESAIDLSSLPFPVQLTSAQSTAGRLILAGTVDTTALLHQAQERSP